MKKSVVKFFRNFLFLGASILCGLAFYSCGEDAGLGGAIDTKAPTLSIDYPKESGSAIRDSFILAGTVSDDKSISRVAVNVKSLDDGGQISETYSASFDSVKNRWWVDINKYEKIDDNHGSWQYPDGNYEFSVTAFDNAGNNSGTYSKTFEIDNTPPVFIISNPGVIKKTNLSESAYGSLFTIDGTISDNHTISFMDVKIYDASGNCVSSESYEGENLPFYREEDVATAGGTSVQIAQYSKEPSTALNTRYKQLHESDSGTEYYYAEIKLTDSTKVYQDPWGDGSRSAEELSADQLGNSTSTVYLYDDVYASLMSAKKGLGLSAANLKDIISGVYTGSANKDEVLKVLNDKAYDTSLVEDDPMANKLSFSLNPEANPTYNVNGFEFGFGDDAVQSASTGNTVSVTISAGLDGTNIAPEIVRVWMKEYKERPTDAEAIKTDLRTLEKQVEILEKAETEFLDALHKSETAAATTVKTGDSDWLLIYDYSLNNSKSSSVSTKTFSVTLPEGIKLSKYYILGVTGYDIEDVEFAQNSVYGFEGNTAGVPPTLKIETPANLSVWGDFAKPQFSGTATISSKSLYLTELTATLTIQDETTNKTEGEFTDTITCKIENDKQTWEFSEAGALTWDSENEKWNLDATKLPGLVELYNKKAKTNDGVYWLATLTVSGKSSSGHEGESSQSIHIDTVAPKVSLASVTPSVSGSDYFGGTDTNTYLNGTVTVKGNIDEQNMADSDDAVSYDILAATGDDEPVSILSELIAHADELGVAFDGKIGKVVSINIPFNTKVISEFFHAFKGAAEDEKIKIEVKVTVKDKAGNLGTCSSNILNDGKYFIIYQETDRPKIELGNADSAIVKADDVKINHNLFGTTSNNKLTISFSDDDSIAEYEVSVYNDKGELLPNANVSAQGENTPKANPYTFKPKKTTASLSYILPSEEAKYQIEIKAHDEFYLPATSLSSPNPYGEKIVEKFFVAVDSGAPEVEISKPAVGSFQSGSVQIEGSVSKAVDLEGTLTKTGSTKTEDTKKFSLKSTQMTKDGKSYNWTLPADVAEDGEYSIDVKVTDIYGQTAGKSRTFKVDTKSPEIKTATTSVDSANGLVPLDEMEYITLRTDVTDGAESKSVAGVSVVKYYLTTEKFTADQLKTENISQIKTAFDGTNWTQMNQGSTNDENVTSFNASVPVKTFATDSDGQIYEGKAYLYVATEDNVGNFAIKEEPVEINLDKSAPVIVVSDFSTKDPSAKFKVVIEDSNPDSLTSSDPEFVTVGDGETSEGTGSEGANEKKYENISLSWSKYKDDPNSDKLEVEKAVTFTATDTNGRKTTKKVTLKCDNRAPKVTRTPGDLFSKSNALEITGTITDKNFSGDATVYLVPIDSTFETKDVSIPFSASADASNGYNYTANITGLDDTTYNIAIVAKDSFGNKSYWSTDASKTTAVTGSDTSNVGNIGNSISIDSTAPLATVKLSVSNENNDAKVLGNAKTGIDADSTGTASKVYSSDKIKFDSKYYTNRTFTISGVITEANLVCTDADIASAGSVTKVPTLSIVKESSKGRESVAVGAGEFVVNYAGKVGNDIPWSFTKTYKEDGSDDGIYEFTLEVWDMSKQQFKKTVTVVLDTTAPEVAITSPVEGESFESQPTAKIAYSDDGVGINATSDSAAIVYEVFDVTKNETVDISGFEKFNASATGSLTFADSFATEGTFKIRAIVTDYLGHTKESAWNTFYFDKSKPKVDEGGVGASGLTTNGVKENESVKKFTLSGTVSDTNALYNDGEADSNGKTAITISTTVKKTVDGVLKDVEEEWKIPLTLTDGKKAAKWEKEFVIGSENSTATNYLPDGTYNFTIVATDVANKTNQISRTVKVDTIAPTFGEAKVATEASSSGWYRTSDLRIKGTATDNDGTGISVVYFQTSVDDGENWSSKTELAGTTDWSGTVEKLVSKKTKVRVIAEDNAHNTSAPVVLGPFNIDTAEPALVADSVKVVKTDATEEAVSSLYVNGKSALVIKFKASDGEAGDNSSGVNKVYISPYAKIQTETGLTEKTSSNNEFSVTVDKTKLSTGTIYARIYDNAGNYSDVNLLSTTLDNEAPKIPSVTLEDKNTAFKAYTATEDENGNQIYYVHGSDSHTFKLSGIATDNFGITSVEYKLGEDNPVKNNQTEFSWNFDNLTLTEDVNLTITVTDNAENTSTKTLVIKQDNSGPAVADTEFPSGFAASNVVLKGTVSDANLSSAADAFKVWLVPVQPEGQSATATTTAKEGVISLTKTESGTNWEASFSSLNDGVQYNIAIVAKDALGNISKYSSNASETTAQTGTDTSLTAVATLGSAFTIDIDAPKLDGAIKIGTAENPTSEIPADGFFVKNDVPIYIKGKLTDNSASGVKSAYYKLYDSITVNEVNKTADASPINVENDGNFTITIAKTLITKSGAINAVFFDNVGNYEKVTLVNFTYDPESPKIQSSTITDKTEHFTAYENGKDSSNNRIFYLNNDSPHKFTIGGVATDNLGLAKVQLDLAGSKLGDKSNSFEITDADKLASWSFDDLDLSGVESGALATITLTDKAGNIDSTSLNIQLDKVGPEGIHDTVTDKDGQDLYFRMGENDNLLSELKKWQPSIAALSETDKDVGGKYSATTYGNSQTIRFRGKFDDKVVGSGVDMIYYLLTTTEPTTEDIENFRKDYTKATGYFSLFENGKVEKRRVAYKDAEGTRKFTEDVESNFKTMISGFTSPTQYLILVAVDKVGNAKLDGNYYTINVDDELPEIEPLVTENIITNGKINDTTVDETAVVIGYTGENAEDFAKYTIRGTVDDAKAGIASLSVDVKINETTTVKIDENSTTYGTIKTWDASETAKPNKKNWAITLNKNLFVKANEAGKKSITVSLTAIDKAGSGNLQKASAATIVLDTDAPTVTLNNPSDADSSTTDIEINGTIELSGTVKDGNTLPENGENDVSNTVTAIRYVQVESGTTSAPADTASGWQNLSGLTIKDNYSFNVTGFATTSLEDEKYYYIQAVAVDKAGNTGYSPAKLVKVSQDSDRPVVKITNLTPVTGGAYPYILKYGTKSQIIATVSDDDGIGNVYISESPYNGTDTKPTTSDYVPTTGTLTFTPSADTTANSNVDGEKKFYVYVQDTAGKEFYTTYYAGAAAASTAKYLNVPKLKVNDTALTDSANAAQFVYFSDSTSPEVGIINALAYKAGENATSAGAVNGGLNNTTKQYTEYEAVNASYVIGGTERQWVQFKISASDASGISGIYMEISYKDKSDAPKTLKRRTSANVGTEGSVVSTDTFVAAKESDGTTDSTTTKIWTTDKIPFADAKGNISLKIIPYDASGLQGNGQVTFVADTTGPEIKITSPEPTDEVTGTVSVVGIATDQGGSKTASTKWLIPTRTQRKMTDDNALYTATKDLWLDTGFTAKSTASSWTFELKSGEISAYDTDGSDNTSGSDGGYAQSVADGVFILPFYVLSTDELGNRTIKRDYTIKHNPDADRPKTTISYPDQSGRTLGGTIRVTGESIIPVGEATVKAVYLQIGTVTGGVASFGDDAKTKASSEKVFNENSVNTGGYGYTVKTPADVKTDNGFASALNFGSAGTSTGWWGIPVTKTSSAWNFSLNANGELDPASGSTNHIAIRACAVNSDGKVGAWSATYFVDVDSTAPTQIATLRQFAASGTNAFSTTDVDSNLPAENTTAIRSYEAEMYLKGDWYLTVQLEDESLLDSYSVKKGSQTLTSGYYASSKKWTFSKDGSVDKILIGDTVSAPEGFTVKHVSRTLFIPVDKTEEKVDYTVSVTDSNETGGHTINAVYSLRIDNAAPTITKIYKGSDSENSPALTQNFTVNDENYIFTLGGKVTENGSGLERVVFYYVRENDDSKTYNRQAVLDPLVKSATGTADSKAYLYNETAGTDDTTSAILTKRTFSQDPEHSYDLWTLAVNGKMKADGYTFVAGSSLAGNKHIRKGGLIEVGGILRRIESISGATVTFDSNTGVTADTDTTAYFPYAQVVDNTNTEKTESTSANPFKFQSGDDGDLMPETVSGSKSTGYLWDSSVHTTNIPDGPAKLVVLVFDKAGNVSGQTYTVKVENSAPRLAKVFLGTDLNSNDSWQANEFVGYDLYNANETYGIGTTEVKASQTIQTASYGSSFIIKDKLAVVAEFVGGNGDIIMVYGKDATGATPVPSTGTGSGISAAANETITSLITATDKIGSVTYNKKTVTTSLKGFTLTSNQVVGLADTATIAETNDGTGKKASFTFWDSTEELVQGSTSQNCVLYVTDFAIDLHDGLAPTVVVNPFYWQSLNSNSIYGSGDEDNVSSVSDLKGHIELEADWTATDITGKKLTSYDGNASGTALDADPKVSGKITFTGTAYDEHALSKITATFGDVLSSVDIATYDKGNSKWTVAEATIGTQGYEVTVNDAGKVYSYSNGAQKTTTSAAAAYGVFNDTAYFGQKGHKIYWTLSIDTEKLTAKVGADISLSVKAKDLSKNETADSEVPPIISTGYIPGQELAGDVKYTVKDGETNKPSYTVDVVPYITEVKTSLSSLKSSNPSVYTRTALGHYTVRSDETVEFVGFNLGDSASLNISSLLTSGSYDFEVSGIKALNNLNANNSRGAYNSTISDSSSYNVKNNYAYNRFPNNDNNNLLTDDIWFDVWQFNNRAAVPITGKIEQPVMKIRPTDGKIGFAFVNGPLYFSMGGSQSSQDYSYQYWAGSYDLWSSIGFTYDSFGNSYGVGAGGDSNSGEGDAFILASSKFGIGAGGERGSYDGANTLRLERIGQYNDGAFDIDKQKIKSPSIVSSQNGTDKTNLYLAYYDAMNDEIRFKSGTTNNGNVKRDSTTSWVRKVYELDGGGYTGAWVYESENGNNLGCADGDFVYFCDANGNLVDGNAYVIKGLYKNEPTSNTAPASGKKEWAFQISNGNGNSLTPFTSPLGKTSNSYTDYTQGHRAGFKNISADNVYIKIVKTEDTGVTKNFGQFQDSATVSNPSYNATYVSILASGKTTYKTGAYVSLGVVPSSVTGGNDTVVAVWLDQANPALPILRYAYNSDPINNPGSWNYVDRVFPANSNYSYAGEYCKVAVDQNGGVHIAAYDQKNLDLIYAYLPADKKGVASEAGDFKTCIVDSNGVVGSNLNIDVGINDEGKVVPYISYYATSIIRPKLAYYVGGFSATDIIEAGAAKDLHTGKWECANVPTESNVEMQSLQHNDINVGLWKDAGVIVDSTSDKYTTGTSSTTNQPNAYNSVSNGQIYGNGTANPVLGYAIKINSKSGAIETAQMK